MASTIFARRDSGDGLPLRVTNAGMPFACLSIVLKGTLFTRKARPFCYIASMAPVECPRGFSIVPQFMQAFGEQRGLARPMPGRRRVPERGRGHGLQRFESVPEQTGRGRSDARDAQQFSRERRSRSGSSVASDDEMMGRITDMLEEQQFRRAVPQGEGIASSWKKVRSPTFPALRSARPCSLRALAIPARMNRPSAPASRSTFWTAVI